MNTQQTEEIAEKLYNQTMRDIEYGDTRDNPQWKEAVRRGFMAYATEALTRQREEIVKEVEALWKVKAPIGKDGNYVHKMIAFVLLTWTTALTNIYWIQDIRDNLIIAPVGGGLLGAWIMVLSIKLFGRR